MTTPIWAKFTLPAAVVASWLLYKTFQPLDELTFLCTLYLPLYLLHQCEEHYKNGYKKLSNRAVFGSKTDDFPQNDFDVLWINLIYIWSLHGVVILTGLYDPLVVVALPVISASNAVGHILFAISRAKYHQGLFTSCISFGFFLYLFPRMIQARIPAGYFVLSILVSFFGHLQILSYFIAKSRAKESQK